MRNASIQKEKTTMMARNTSMQLQKMNSYTPRPIPHRASSLFYCILIIIRQSKLTIQIHVLLIAPTVDFLCPPLHDSPDGGLIWSGDSGGR